MIRKYFIAFHQLNVVITEAMRPLSHSFFLFSPIYFRIYFDLSKSECECVNQYIQKIAAYSPVISYFWKDGKTRINKQSANPFQLNTYCCSIYESSYNFFFLFELTVLLLLSLFCGLDFDSIFAHFHLDALIFFHLLFLERTVTLWLIEGIRNLSQRVHINQVASSPTREMCLLYLPLNGYSVDLFRV